MFQEVNQVSQQEPGHVFIRNNDEQKQPKAKIHMIKKKNMKLQLVRKSKEDENLGQQIQILDPFL